MYIGSKRGIISQFERYSLYLSFEPEVWAELAAQVKPTSYRRGEIIRPAAIPVPGSPSCCQGLPRWEPCSRADGDRHPHHRAGSCMGNAQHLCR